MDSPVSITRVQRITDGKSTSSDEILAVEEPLEIQILYGVREKQTQKSISVTMRTPGNDQELALGFLFTEGIIKSIDQIKEVLTPAENVIRVVLNEHEQPLQIADRNFYMTSSCGVCGKSSLDAVRTIAGKKLNDDDSYLEDSTLYQLRRALEENQTVFNQTGGLHASALFTLDGDFIMMREDVGRHNALDKVIGFSIEKKKLPLSRVILLLSGRASFELIQKAAMGGVRIIAAIGAPSSLAVDLAREFDISLIGFLREHRFNIYSGEHRIRVVAHG